MSIDTVIDLIETKLLEDSEWVKDQLAENIYWSNNKDGVMEFTENELPKTLVFIEQAPMTESSTQRDQTEWIFQFKNFTWIGNPIYTKTNFKKYTDLHTRFVAIYNNIIDNLDCAWVSDYLTSDYESIEDRLIVQERFSITVEEIRP